ncbi:D-alanyl-lipoteichoic acid biosynthesis protein DltD [Lentilactobacillus raoultii]|uniref:Protein DltD n=1 Tax=Lentilactobacillus raoultii TaxID=1987503 RepID=A0ABW3PF91_9LACO|nr:D-alanyl-lipoteichoic acid biosynthesis protein DltD [Lentilactobacillus raoultii]
MRIKKRLFEIFGPVFCAGLLVLITFASPVWIKFGYVSPTSQKDAAVSLSPSVLKERLIKQAALNDEYVPFFGSSEWSRFDPFHPAVLAEKYHRSYRPFLLGTRGTQSLTHFFGMQLMHHQLHLQKAVFFISPQWFVPKGENPNAFSFYDSPLETTSWIRSEKDSKMTRFAAHRLLQMPAGHSDKIIADTLSRIATGLKPTAFQMNYINWRHRILLNEDQIYARFRIPAANEKKIEKNAAKLPAKYHFQYLNDLAGKIGRQKTASNDYQINDHFWRYRLKHHFKRLQDFQVGLSYLKSPEYGDFQLVLNQFANERTNVLFIIPPVNQKWEKYTGLSFGMLKKFNHKIKYQLRSQGFNHIDDLSNDGKVNYFMTDTIHPGWRGWLKMDRKIEPFLTKKVPSPHYKINKKFYSKSWQQTDSNFEK